MRKELRVLIVEDSPQDMALINHELRKAGLRFRSRRVESCDAFLRELERRPPDLILSDHGVPGFDGFAALAKARSHCPQAPFIFVTGAAREETARRTAQEGADGYVLKNQLHLLGPAVERALRVAGARASHQPVETAALEAEEHPRLPIEELKEMERFTHAIARDLQLPLSHIESCCELLAKAAGDQLDAKNQNYLKTISEASRQMARLIDDLLAFSRIGQAEMYQLSLSLKDIANEVIHELRRQTEGRDVQWVVGELPEVMGDSVMLWQVMMNLLSNALKFTRSNKHARVEIGARDSAQNHTIYVRDNGVGFDIHSADRLFNVFERLHSSEYEGIGVGLATVRRIIERHGGRVWAEGAAGQGATFYFTLPQQP